MTVDNKARVRRLSGERWWQDWRWVAAIGSTIFAIGFLAFAITTVATRVSVENQDQVLNSLEMLAEDNSVSIEQLERANSGVEELVAFVRDLRAAEEADGDDGPDLQIFVDLLCASEDPVRLAACAQLTEEQIP